MKLYATITSERATKGQGGKYLDIELFGEDNGRLAVIKIRQSKAIPDEYDMDILETSMLNITEEGEELILASQTKAKRQKGDKSHGLHKTCMYDHDHNSGNCEYHD